MNKVIVSYLIHFKRYATIVSSLMLCSCEGNPFDKCASDYNLVAHNYFPFNIIDENTNQNVLLIGQTQYNYDTVKVYHEDWGVAYDGPVPYDGLIALQFIDEQKDKGVVDELISRRYYIYFNYQDIDTIDISFEMKNDKCGYQKMKYFKVAFNDSIYFDSLAPMDQVPGFINFTKMN